MGRVTRLRRPNSLLAYWREGRLCFHNFATRSTVAANPVAIDVLDFFDGWRTSQAAIAHFEQFTPGSVRQTIRELLRQRLLVSEGSLEAIADSHITKEWSAWLPEASFHFSTKDAPYVPSDSSLEQRRATLQNAPQPPKFKSVKGAAKVELPPRSFPDSEFIHVLTGRRTHREFSDQSVALESVSQLLSLVWGVTGYLYAPLFGRLPHKTSPSGGARHPGEVYLMALRVSGLKRGLYHYHPTRHSLETIREGATAEKASRYCANAPHVGRAAALFLMTAVFPRNMWKYQHPRAYRVVLLDAGHLCQTFCLVATWLGLAPFCTAALKDTLIERDLGIDGIRESVLYVAGVGAKKEAMEQRN
jgi:SagB-type dehydrogenase family enzyme